jgi:pyruvate formate lyase activating enzyme
MKIGGFQPFTLTDYPGQIAAIVFTQGCNWRCPYCHNAPLLPIDCPKSDLIPEAYIFDHLSRRRRQLHGLVITGGEPTIQEDLPRFLRKVRRLSPSIKLDTNGSHPDVLRHLLEEGLLDYIAMDIKAPFDQYESIVRRPVDIDALQASVELIKNSGVPHQFRTPLILEPAWHSASASESDCRSQKAAPLSSAGRRMEKR